MAMKCLSLKCVLGISIVAFTAGGILMLFDHYLWSFYSGLMLAGFVGAMVMLYHAQKADLSSR